MSLGSLGSQGPLTFPGLDGTLGYVESSHNILTELSSQILNTNKCPFLIDSPIAFVPPKIE